MGKADCPTRYVQGLRAARVPTSNHIANLVMDTVFRRSIVPFAVARNVEVLNYGDDIALASDRAAAVRECIEHTREQLRRLGFRANDKGRDCEHRGESVCSSDRDWPYGSRSAAQEVSVNAKGCATSATKGDGCSGQQAREFGEADSVDSSPDSIRHAAQREESETLKGRLLPDCAARQRKLRADRGPPQTSGKGSRVAPPVRCPTASPRPASGTGLLRRSRRLGSNRCHCEACGRRPKPGVSG